MFQKTSRLHAWIVVVMLFLFMVINFADKAVIGLAAVPIMHDLGLSPQQFGIVGGSFFLLFTVSGLLFGLASTRIKTRWLLALLSIVWAIAQFPLVGTVTYPVLIACRVLLGAGEGPAYALAAHASYKWFDNTKRNVPTVIVQQGASVGLLLAGPCLTFLITRYDWHAAFLALGVVGCLWTAVWLVVGKDGTVDETRSAVEPEPSPAVAGGQAEGMRFMIKRIATDRTLVGSIILTFAGYAVVSVNFTWFPAYLHAGLGYPASDAGWLFSLMAGVSIPSMLAVAWISRVLKDKGASSHLSRGVMASAPVALAGVFMLCSTTDISPSAKLVCYTIASVLSQCGMTLSPLMVGEVVAARQRGAWLSVVTALGTFAGVLIPPLIGHFVSAAHGTAAGFENGFVLLGSMLIPAGLLGIWLMNPEKSARRLQRQRMARETADGQSAVVHEESRSNIAQSL
jgi:MFS family permease